MKENCPKFQIMMVIDDCPIEIQLRKKILVTGNYASKIIEYQSAAKALDYLTDANNSHLLPQMILLDQHMQGMTGTEFIGEFNKLPLSTT